MRSAALLLVAASLCGCGSAASTAGEGDALVVGEIRAVDRPAPEAFDQWARPNGNLEVVVVSSGYACLDGTECEVGAKTWGECTPESRDVDCQAQLEESRKWHERWLAELAPAAHSEPRIVAELALENRKSVELVAWRTSSGHLCGLARAPSIAEWPKQIVGPCTNGSPCETVCPAILPVSEKRFFLVGMVARSAEAVRIETERGETQIRELEGLRIPGSDLQPLLADLGDETWQKLEVFRGGKAIETIEVRARDEGTQLCDADECVEGDEEDAE